MKRQTLVAATLLSLCLCGASASTERPWPDAAGMAALIESAARESAHLALDGRVASYDRGNLAEYLKDAAPRILAYDYLWTVAAVLTDTRSGVKFTLEAHRFGSDLDAFGATTLERDFVLPGAVIPLAGRASLLSAYFTENRLHVWWGPSYVRVVPDRAPENIQATALEVAAAVLGRLPPVEGEPPVFRILPTRGLLTESLTFQRRNVLGQETLGTALRGTYGRRLPERRLDVEMELFLFDGGDAAGARSTYAHLERHLAVDGSVRPVGALGEAALAARHPEHGPTHVMRQGRYVVMLRKVARADMAEAYLREIGKNIRLAR